MRRRRFIIWIGMACALGLAITVALLLRLPERKMVTFRVVDLGTETPVTNVSFLIRRRWTTLPLQKVGLPANWAWRTESRILEMGTLRIRLPERVDYKMAFFREGYSLTTFRRDGTNLDEIAILMSGPERRVQTDTVVIPLYQTHGATSYR